MPDTPETYRGNSYVVGLLERVRVLRARQTPAEAIFWELVRDRQFRGLKFRRQHQIGSNIVDFYCHEHRLVVELDGAIHDYRGQPAHDRERDAYLRARGLRIFRVANDFLLNAPSTVCTDLASFIATASDNPAPPPV